MQMLWYDYKEVFMNTITLTLTNQQIDTLQKLYQDETHLPPPAYAVLLIKTDQCTITVYQSNKVVFQGKEAEYHASFFRQAMTETHAGSDEVGTGDYFGPVCVCACIVESEIIPQLEPYKIQDSKAITDSKILEIGPVLIKLLPHSILVVDNKKYNQIHQKYNMNQIKALLHNQAYLHLEKKHTLPKLVVIDQFTPEASYYRYLSFEKEVVRGIRFETKAENKYLAVACASIIARYTFLIYFEQLNKKYEWTFPKGAGTTVDQNAREFVEKFGFSELENVAKLHFANTSRVKE